jgi:hypothetical protein
MVLNPKVHLFINITNAKGSHLLIVPLDVWADDLQDVGPRGANYQSELSQTKDIQTYININKTTVFKLHAKMEWNRTEISHKRVMLQRADG